MSSPVDFRPAPTHQETDTTTGFKIFRKNAKKLHVGRHDKLTAEYLSTSEWKEPVIIMHSQDVTPQWKPAKITAEHESMEDFLSERDIKPTRQRVAIATHVFDREQHLSADAILERVNSDSATTNVSKATVYNTLKIFVQSGILNEVALDPQRILFDTNIHSHHHIFNIDTGEIRDINPVDVDLSNVTGINTDEQISGVDLIIRVNKQRS